MISRTKNIAAQSRAEILLILRFAAHRYRAIMTQTGFAASRTLKKMWTLAADSRGGGLEQSSVDFDPQIRYYDHAKRRVRTKTAERCWSGRTGLPAKQLCWQRHRGFESPPLRQASPFGLRLARPAKVEISIKSCNCFFWPEGRSLPGIDPMIAKPGYDA